MKRGRRHVAPVRPRGNRSIFLSNESYRPDKAGLHSQARDSAFPTLARTRRRGEAAVDVADVAEFRGRRPLKQQTQIE
jgi:hypothetical protein